MVRSSNPFRLATIRRRFGIGQGSAQLSSGGHSSQSIRAGAKQAPLLGACAWYTKLAQPMGRERRPTKDQRQSDATKLTAHAGTKRRRRRERLERMRQLHFIYRIIAVSTVNARLGLLLAFLFFHFTFYVWSLILLNRSNSCHKCESRLYRSYSALPHRLAALAQ